MYYFGPFRIFGQDMSLVKHIKDFITIYLVHMTYESTNSKDMILASNEFFYFVQYNL